MRPIRTYEVHLAAVMTCVAMVLIPLPSHPVQAAWTDELAGQIISERAQHPAQNREIVYTRYLAQLDLVHQALARGDRHSARVEMTRFIGMLAANAEGISDAAAISLLLQVDRVTPGEFVDDTARPLLLQVRALVLDRDEGIAEHPIDGHHGTTVQPAPAFWWEETPLHLGYGWPLVIVLGIPAASRTGPSRHHHGDRRPRVAETCRLRCRRKGGPIA